MNNISACGATDIFSPQTMDDRMAAMAMIMAPLHPAVQPMMASSLVNSSYPIMLTGWTSTVPPPTAANQNTWAIGVNGGDGLNSSFPTPYFPPRKTRRRLSVSESRLLNAAFEMHPHPSADMRAKLEKQLGMSRRAVQIWFQNKRAKRRRIEKDGSKGLPSSPGDDDEHFNRGSDSLLVYAPITAPTATLKQPTMATTSSTSLCFDELDISLSDDPFLNALSNDMELLGSCGGNGFL